MGLWRDRVSPGKKASYVCLVFHLYNHQCKYILDSLDNFAIKMISVDQEPVSTD